MTISEAHKIVDDLYDKQNMTEEEEFIFIEALEFLINTAHDSDAMMTLGGLYYEQKKFDLALKYYEMAATHGNDFADECLGYIWYYGRTGERDYERAFNHFSAAKERGKINAAYKLADMYKNGYYVEKDYDKYCEIIEELYPKVENDTNVFSPLVEICMRLAAIREKQGDKAAAINLYLRARNYLSQRLVYNNFFGNLNMMKWLIDDLYKLVPFGMYRPLELYDLHYLLQIPGEYSIEIIDEMIDIDAVEENGECAVKFNGKWFRNRDEFFGKAEYNGTRLTELYFDITVYDERQVPIID